MQESQPPRASAAPVHVWRALAAGLLSLAFVVLADVTQRRAVATADDRFLAPFFAGFDAYDADLGARPAHSGARLKLRGLGRAASVNVGIVLATPVTPDGLRIQSNGEPVVWDGVSTLRPELTFATTTDAAGRLNVLFDMPAGAPDLLVRSVDVRQSSLSSPPWSRLGLYALILALCCGLAAWGVRPRAAASGLGLSALVMASGLWWDRLTTLALLPGITAALALGLACGWVATRLRAELSFARWVAAAAVLRLALVIQPAFPCIDLGFHSGTLGEFVDGALIVSRAPNPDQHAEALPVPYPPALYAILAPAAQARWASGHTLVRLSLGLLEGSAPLMVLLLARAGGCSPVAAGAAAAVAAVMPEGTLVLGKGLAANALASWVGLAALTAMLRRRWILAAPLVALAFLSHFGQSLLLLPLIVCWSAYGFWRRLLDARAVRGIISVTLFALLVAWLAYYRAVFGLTLEAGAGVRDSWSVGMGALGVRWVQLGKILQDLALKFGGLTLFPVVVGLRRSEARVALQGLLMPWIVLGVAAGVAVVLTPVPLRFEYFLMPALSVCAGLAAESWWGSARMRTFHWICALVFASQAAIGLLLLADRFRLISVILESNRWPFPIRF